MRFTVLLRARRSCRARAPLGHHLHQRVGAAFLACAATALVLGVAMAGSAAAATGIPSSGMPVLSSNFGAGGAPVSMQSAAGQDLFVHDPAMAKEGNTYYVFSTGDPAGVVGNGNIQIRSSTNLRKWKFDGTVFANKPSWIADIEGNIPNLWAPDISFFDGEWHLYYAASSFGSNNSLLALATTPTLNPRSPDYRWTDDGLVFRSTSADNFNAIDPSLVTAQGGSRYLVFGSFFAGIEMLPLDSATGKPPVGATPQLIAAKPFPDPEEGASITFHDGFYYLFVSVDTCCAGISSTYHVQVGRSTSVTGPYVDAAGVPMTSGGGMEVQGTDAGMIGPGGESAFTTSSGEDWLVYHYYDAYANGDAWLQIRPLSWVTGWPVTGQPMVPIPGE